MQISRELANTIVDPYAFAKWDPAHNAFSELRKNAPIAKAKPDDYDEFWIVSRYDDAQFVEKNLNKIFHCGDRGSTGAGERVLARRLLRRRGRGGGRKLNRFAGATYSRRFRALQRGDY